MGMKGRYLLIGMMRKTNQAVKLFFDFDDRIMEVYVFSVIMEKAYSRETKQLGVWDL